MKTKYENIINNINLFYKIATIGDEDHDRSIYHGDEDDYFTPYKYDPVRLNEYEKHYSKKNIMLKSRQKKTRATTNRKYAAHRKIDATTY